LRWLDAGFHGEMGYMQRHGSMRSRPQELQPGTVRVLVPAWITGPPMHSRRRACWPTHGGLRALRARA
jgi:epoxyqueuosine reductase QueG